jgi:lipoate-protein ligase B
MLVEDLGLLGYRDAWAHQERVHEQVLAGAPERLLLVEHPPVITYGRRPGQERNLLARAEQLQQLGVEIVQSDRGGDITFHGPGQLVAYPIVRLADHGLSVSGYVHRLEDIVIATLASFGVVAAKDSSAVGVWAGDAASPAKICAVGVRIRRGVSLHGIALNVTTDLRYFDLIVPCGLSGRAVTSLGEILGNSAPTMDELKHGLANEFSELLL